MESCFGCGTYQHMEGAVGDVLASKADGDDVLARLGGCVVDVEGTIVVLNHVHVKLCPIRRGHRARHLPLAGCFGIYRDHRLLPDLDAGAQAGTCHTEEPCQGSVTSVPSPALYPAAPTASAHSRKRRDWPLT